MREGHWGRFLNAKQEKADLRHGKQWVGGVTLLHEALQVMLHELHDHEHIIQLLTHHHLHPTTATSATFVGGMGGTGGEGAQC